MIHSRLLFPITALLIAAAGLTAPFFVESASMAQEESRSDKVLRHVVLFKFKDASSETDVQKVIDAFRKLPEQIPQIADFEYGTDNSPEKLANGFTHCFLLTFRSEDDRAAYLPHPAHKRFGETLGPHLDKVLVIDYWANE